MSDLFRDLEWRGLVHQVTDPALADTLDASASGLTVYAGFDPTAESLHVGNLLQLATLRRFQLAGHRPIVLAGGATGMIGDPGGKSAERNLLDAEALQRNIDGVMPQLRQFLDFEGDNAAVLVNNYDWTAPLSMIEFLRDVGKHFTVNALIARENVRTRLDDPDKSISYTEFSYGLLQAFDYWHLFREHGCTLQIGGSDQWTNIVGGVDLIRRKEGATVHALCTPLVTKADGSKFGKSESGAVWLDPTKTSPYAFYQFFVRAEDAKVVEYLKLFTFLAHDAIDELADAVAQRPQAREAQRVLAREVTTLVHGAREAERAEAASKLLFEGAVDQLDEDMLTQVFAELPSVTHARSTAPVVVDVLVELGLSPSKTAARQAIQQGGVKLNAKPVESADAVVDPADLLHGRYAVLRRGKREYGSVRFE
jgi:tyrosyl-tRNA synthetase